MIDAIVLDRSPVEREAAVALLAVAADPVRWRLLAELAAAGTRCVCDLQPVGGVAPNVLSYHLKVLRDAGLVQARREGTWQWYSVVEESLSSVQAFILR